VIPTPPLGGLARSEEDRALVETITALADGPLARTADADVDRIAAARAELVGTGLWALGIPEESGGGGADERTVALVIAALATAWPALAVAVTHVHAAGALLADQVHGRELLAEVSTSGRAVAVVELDAADGWEPGTDIAVPRIDVAADSADLIVLIDATTAARVARDRVTFGDVLPRTGLDGARTVPARFRVDDADQLTAPRVAEARRVLYRGLTAVAAGIADGAVRGAVAYASERVQFGGPLTALPAVRDALFGLRSAASTALSAAFVDVPDEVAAAALLDRTLDLAVEVAADGVQAHGGYGFLTEYPAEGRLRDAISLCAAADAVAVRERIARAALAPSG
jgi:alkylation response protein AidB-like acyl-CoA dehydrogenase